MSLSDEDLERLADKMTPRLIQGVRSQHHEFWIDPEQHYQDHQKIRDFTNEEIYELRGLIKLFQMTKGLWAKAFLGFAIVGSFILFLVGFGWKGH